jgi:hypothetical protein
MLEQTTNTRRSGWTDVVRGYRVLDIRYALVVGNSLSRRQSSARYRFQRIAINLDARGMTMRLQYTMDMFFH